MRKSNVLIFSFILGSFVSSEVFADATVTLAESATWLISPKKGAMKQVSGSGVVQVPAGECTFIIQGANSESLCKNTVELKDKTAYTVTVTYHREGDSYCQVKISENESKFRKK